MMTFRWFLAELVGLHRGRLVASTAAVVSAVLLFIGLLAVTTESAFVTYAMIAYIMLPLAFAPIAAAWMKSPRATGLSRAIFTSPSTQSSHFLARVGVLGVMVALVLAATLPILGVFIAFSGFQPIHGKFLALGAMLAVSSAAAGTLMGSTGTGRSFAAPVGAAVLFALASIVAVMSMDQLQQSANSKFLLRAMHVLPVTLAWESLGLSIASASVNADPMRSALAFAGQTVAMLLAGALMAIRVHGPETWRIAAPGRIAIGMVVLLLAASPVAIASVDYSGKATPVNPGTEVFAGGDEYPVWLVKADDPTPSVKYGPSNDAAHFDLDRATNVDFVYYLRIAPGDPVPIDEFEVDSKKDIRVQVPADAITTALAARESFAFTGNAKDYDGKAITQGTILRIPATVTAATTSDLGKVTTAIDVTITFTDTHAGLPRETTHMTLFKVVDTAPAWIALAGTLPIAGIGVDQGVAWLRRRA